MNIETNLTEYTLYVEHEGFNFIVKSFKTDGQYVVEKIHIQRDDRKKWAKISNSLKSIIKTEISDKVLDHLKI